MRISIPEGRARISAILFGSLNAMGFTVLLSASLVEIRPAEIHPSGNHSIDPAALAALSPSAGIKSVDLVPVLERPVFHADRKAYQPPKIVAAPAAPARARLELAGLATGQGGRWAYLKDLDKGETLRVTAGDVIQGWTISEIEDGLVRLERGSDVMTLGAAEGAEGQVSGTSTSSGPRTRRANRPRTQNRN